MNTYFSSTFIVEVTDIKVDEKYFSFKYKVTRDGALVKEDVYSDSHAHSTEVDRENFINLLQKSYAVELALAEVV